jgi:hypothetical protein
MPIDRVSEIIAHFIGLFDTELEEARMRSKPLDGERHAGPQQPALSDEVTGPDFASNLLLKDYEPGVNYRNGQYDIDFYARPGHLGRVFDESLEKLAAIASRDLVAPHFRLPGHAQHGDQPELILHTGPGSVAAHVAQVNLLQDDDYLDMTGGPYAPRDTTFVVERMAEFSTQAGIFIPFSSFHRTDSYEGLQELAGDIHDYTQAIRDSGATSFDTGNQHDFVLASNEIDGSYINGAIVTEAPLLDDLMPERGIAAPPKEPEESQTSLEQAGSSGNSLTVAAGANVVANILTLTETAIMAPVMAVMGDYHQIDAITQVYVYSDRDEIDQALSPTGNANHAASTVAFNIAAFEHSQYENTATPGTQDDTAALIFPTAWRVSYVEGDVSFVHWIEQYNFVTDNDTMTVTTSGSEATVLTGGNALVNLSSFLGIGMQYDLIIVGGNVLDMSVITQIAILYDNDWVRASGDPSVQSGNNLLWNQASIHNVGANDRFEVMPDYIVDTVNAINARDPNMPAGLSTDSNFQGYEGLNVLYITGNLYDVNVIKQVCVLGDSDDVTQAAANLLAHNENATVSIDTGSNAVINIAHIVDYDSFGSTTYLAGQLYSDAILIQGGILENDTSGPNPAGDRLANEVIAFLDHENPAADTSDGVINAGHDLSWTLAHPVDVMQTVGA